MEEFGFPKRITLRDPKLLAMVRRFPCLVCGQSPVDAHHVTTKGAGGADIPTNVMPLCRTHHQEIHSLGPKRMAWRYEGVWKWLKLAQRDDVLKG